MLEGTEAHWVVQTLAEITSDVPRMPPSKIDLQYTYHHSDFTHETLVQPQSSSPNCGIIAAWCWFLNPWFISHLSLGLCPLINSIALSTIRAPPQFLHGRGWGSALVVFQGAYKKSQGQISSLRRSHDIFTILMLYKYLCISIQIVYRLYMFVSLKDFFRPSESLAISTVDSLASGACLPGRWLPQDSRGNWKSWAATLPSCPEVSLTSTLQKKNNLANIS